jgi:conjugal transfer ATP-binding protein TraC
VALTNADILAMFNEGGAFLDFLPYIDEENRIFINADGSLGCVWETGLFAAEAASASSLEAFGGQVAGIISRFPPGISFQVILWSDGSVAPILEEYRRISKGEDHPVVAAATEARLEHFQQAVRPRCLRVYLTARYFSPERDVPWNERVKRYFNGRCQELDLRRIETTRAVERFIRMIAPIESALKSAGMELRLLDSGALVQWLYRVLNPRRSQSVGKGTALSGPLRDQVLYHAPAAQGHGVILDGYSTRVVTLKDLPSGTMAGMLSVSPAGGHSLMDVCREFMIVFNFTVPDQAEALARLKFQKTFAFIQRTSSMGDVSEEAVQKKEELSNVISESFKGGKAVIYARAHFIPFALSEEDADRAADAFIAGLGRLGFEGLKEEIIAPSLFVSCLPLNFDHRQESFVRRTRRLLADNFSDILPWYGSFRGTRTPAAMYINRRSEPVLIDFFDSETNPHGIIIGASGAGKSFLTNDLIYQNYRLGSYFFVLDKGHSYRKTCSVLNGQYVSFEIDRPLCINPFVKKPTPENQAFLVEMLAMMASGGDDRDRLSREERGILQIAMLRAYDQQVDAEVTLSDVVQVLRLLSADDFGFSPDMGQRLALRLTPFTRTGQYGKFFDGPNELSGCGRFTVFELAQLSRYPDLQLVVLLNIMFFITNFVSEPAVVAERKFLIIDEAWQLLKMSNTADFIANAFKTFRKYRCSAVAVTQEANDLLQQKSGSAIMANTANKVFLKQDPSLIEGFRKELSLSDETGDVLRSLSTVKGKYSEAFVVTPSGSGVIRLVPDPFLYWAANSEPRNNEYLNTVRERLGGDLLAALKECAREHPYGLR